MIFGMVKCSQCNEPTHVSKIVGGQICTDCISKGVSDEMIKAMKKDVDNFKKAMKIKTIEK